MGSDARSRSKSKTAEREKRPDPTPGVPTADQGLSGGLADWTWRIAVWLDEMVRALRQPAPSWRYQTFQPPFVSESLRRFRFR